MSDYYQPRPFLVVAASRSGSTFLCHCLDSHPQVSCERDSPLDAASYWQQWTLASDEREQSIAVDVMHALWNRSGYRAAGFKLSYRQARRSDLSWLVDEVDGRVIHLYRSNPLRTVVSSAINTAVRDGVMQHPHHTFKEVGIAASIVLDPDQFVAQCRRYVSNVDDMLRDLLDLADKTWLSLTYDLVVGAEGREASGIPAGVASALCKWLDVEQRSLTCGLRRVNPQPLSEIVENWSAVAEAVEADGQFVEWLEE